MKKKILKIVLMFTFLSSLCVVAFAVKQPRKEVLKAVSKEEQKKETVLVKYKYLNKDMDKSVEKNKTSEKEFLNAYVLLNKMCRVLSIDKNSFNRFKQLIFSPKEKIKLDGKLYLNLNLKEKKIFEKIVVKDISRVGFTPEEFFETKKEVVGLIKNKIKQQKDKKYIKKLEDRIKKIENVKYKDVVGLTKNLKHEKKLIKIKN